MTKQHLLFLDAETYYDDEYSLSKMPTPSYILDPRFELQMMAVREGGGASRIIDGVDFPAWLEQFDPAITTTVTFNALFDNAILAWRYGFVPRMMLDSMGMARALRGHKLASFSLAKVSEFIGLGAKGNALVKVKGLRRSQISAALWAEFCMYARQDNDLSAGIFTKLIPEFPLSERKVMDLVLRCAIEPRFVTDTSMLTEHLVDVRKYKADLLEKAGGDVDSLMSSDKFKGMLEALGVTIQYKTSPTGKQIPAFAKTDEFMEELGEHPDDRVQALVAARLGHKSTLEETRSQTLLDIAGLPWESYRDGNPRLYSGGNMPVPLRYGGAHTHRLSGDWKMNMQNLPTMRGSKGKSKLRLSLLAPPGHMVVTADLAQIEARLAAWICGATELLAQFRDKKDPYAKLASEIFGYPVDRKKQILEGFIGKTGILGLGYGCGIDHFFDMVIKMARAQELDLGPKWTLALAAKSVNTYRRVHHPIPTAWRTLDGILAAAWLSSSYAPAKFGPVTISYGKVELPNGLYLNYDSPNMAHLPGERPELSYRYGKRRHKIYGAKMLENIVQALARIIVMNASLRLADRGYRFVLQGHDELVFIVPEADVDNAKQIIHTEMVRPPSWAPHLPLAAEVNAGKSYGDSK